MAHEHNETLCNHWEWVLELVIDIEKYSLSIKKSSFKRVCSV